jgi:hypothetical protein
MSPTNVKVVFIGAIAFVLWGGYSIAKASYTAIAWNKTEGTIVDLERNVWTCGKGVSECYNLIAGYHARNNYYTVLSDKKFSRNKPSHLLDTKVVIYYDPLNPAEAVLGGEYGPMSGGIILFIVGLIVLLIFWYFWKKEQS